MADDKQRDEFEEVKGDVHAIKIELQWLRRGLYALAAVVASPKVGGPDLSNEVSAVLQTFGLL